MTIKQFKKKKKRKKNKEGHLIPLDSYSPNFAKAPRKVKKCCSILVAGL